MRSRVRSEYRAGVLLLVATVVLLLLGGSVASAARVTMTGGVKPSNTAQARCTSQAVSVTTPTATAANPTTKTLVVSGLDNSAACNGKALFVTIYDPKQSATWTAAQKTKATSTVTATSLTLTSTTAFTPMVALYAYVTIGGWQVPSTFVPGPAYLVRTLQMREHQHDKCLTVNTSGALADGQGVVISTCSNGNVPTNQRWVQYSDGTLRAGAFCLTVPAGTVVDVMYLVIKTCAGGGARTQWVASNANSDPGTFQWISGVWFTPDPTNDGCLDNEGESSANGTKQILYHCIDNHGNQEWELTVL